MLRDALQPLLRPLLGPPLARRGARTPIQRAISILRRFGPDAHVYLPGVGMLNGLQAGNYIDSAGTTQGTVDQPVGLTLDAAGSVTNVTFGAWEIGTNGAVAPSGSSVVVTANGAGTANAGVALTGLTIGTTYQVDAISGAATAASLRARTYTNAGFTSDTPVTNITVTANATVGYFFTATATNMYVGFALVAPTNGQTAAFTINSVRQVTGIHATQPTTASKPILRRGAVNLLTYSQDFTNAAWAADAITKTATRITPTATTAIHRTSHSATTVTSGGAHTAAVRAKADGYRYLYVNGAASPNQGQACFDLQTGTVVATATGLATISPDSDGSYICAVSGTAALATNAMFLQVNSTPVASDNSFLADGTSGINIYAAALFQGTYTADQIQALGGIPLTTTAPASTALGPYFLQFDGANDSLSLGGPLFQMADDHCVVAGGVTTKTAGQGTLFVNAAEGAPRMPAVCCTSTGNFVFVEWYDGTQYAPVTTTHPNGVPFVLTGRRLGSSLTVKKNGSVVGSATAFNTAVATTKSIIGDGVFGPWQGSVYPVIAIKGTVTDPELLLLEKLVAQMSGVTL